MQCRSVIPLLLLVCAILPDRAQAQLWTYQDSPSPNNLRGIAFADSLDGVIVGDNGTLLRTSDGGSHWNAVTTGITEQLLSISLLPDRSGLIVGSKGTILHTTDGFATWTVQASGTTAFLVAVDCRDSLNALAVGTGGLILHTTDAGSAWTKQTSGTVSPLRSVAFRNDSCAAAVGGFGALVQTTDGGSHWTLPPVPYHGGLNAVAFYDSLNGFVAADGGVGLRTTDGGAVWWLVSTPARFVTLPRYGPTTGAAVGNGLSLTATAGAFWSEEYVPKQFEAAAFRDQHSLLGVGLHGLYSTCLLDLPLPPTVILDAPADQSSSVPMIMTETIQLGIALRWRKYDVVIPSAFHLQIGGDSTFSSDLYIDGAVSVPTPDDTTTIVRLLEPERPTFWHMRTEFGARTAPWSETRRFVPTAGTHAASVRMIQTVNDDSLRSADSLQTTGPSRWRLQASSLMDSVLVIVGVCTVPLKELRSTRSITNFFPIEDYKDWFMLADTGTDASPWNGLLVRNSFSGRLRTDTTFWHIRAGDVVMLTGKVLESETNDMNTETSFSGFTLRVLNSAAAVPPAHPMPSRELCLRNGQGTPVPIATGEPYEGSRVELTGLSVYAVDDPPTGAFTLVDHEGNEIRMSDASRWFTLRDHRDSASTYAVPPIGTRIDTLRGIVLVEGPGYSLMPVRPADMVIGAPQTGMIAGLLYDDHNQNGIPDPGEPPMPGWRINFDGRVRTARVTDDLGRFSLAGLDSGWYTITREPRFGWTGSAPDSAVRIVHLGVNDTSAANTFGLYFQWNTLAGRVYHDLNENGQADSVDPGLPGWKVRLTGETVDSAFTDSEGNFLFPFVKTGVHYLNVALEPSWEETVPVYFRGYQFDLREFNVHKTGYDFSAHPTPMRSRVGLTVSNDIGTSRTVWFGVRPGATYGIWGVDPLSTTIDYSEGESEIPPVSPGIFDARLIDPRGSDAQFGEGGWTDARGFTSPAQVDSYKVTFLPGYFFGGNYPMTLRWSRMWASTSYTGPVLLIDPVGNTTDMAAADSVVITDPSVGSVLIVAAHPHLTVSDVRSATALPTRYLLGQNYPNPFNPVTAFEIDLPASGHVRLAVYDLLGRQIAVPIEGEFAPGVLRASWDASGHPSGVYFYRLTAGTFTDTKKMLLLR